MIVRALAKAMKRWQRERSASGKGISGDGETADGIGAGGSRRLPQSSLQNHSPDSTNHGSVKSGRGSTYCAGVGSGEDAAVAEVEMTGGTGEDFQAKQQRA